MAVGRWTLLRLLFLSLMLFGLAVSPARALLSGEDVTIQRAVGFSVSHSDIVTVDSSSIEVTCPGAFNLCSADIPGSTDGTIDISDTSIDLQVGSSGGAVAFAPDATFNGFAFLNADVRPIIGVTVTTDIAGLDATRVFVAVSTSIAVDLQSLTVNPGEFFTLDIDYLGGSHLAYHETFIGESTFPTSAELDYIQAGGLTTSSSGFEGSFALTGTAAHATLHDQTGFGFGISAHLNLDVSAIGTKNLFATVDFANLTVDHLSGPLQSETAFTSIAFEFDTSEVLYGIQIRVNDTSGFYAITPAGEIIYTDAPLPANIHIAILAGAPYRLEVVVNRTAGGTMFGRLLVGGVPVDGPVISLGFPGTEEISAAQVYAGLLGQLLTGQLNLDIPDMKIYSEEQLTPPRAPLLSGVGVALLVIALAAAGVVLRIKSDPRKGPSRAGGA